MNRRFFEFISSVFFVFFNKSLKDDVVDGMRTPIDSVMSNLMARLRGLITGMRHLPVKDFTREDFQNFRFHAMKIMVLHLVNSLSELFYRRNIPSQDNLMSHYPDYES